LGRIIDRQGLLPYLGAAFALMLVGSVLVLAWPAAAWLVLFARFLEGVAFAICAILAPALASRSASRHHFSIVIGLVATVIPIGQLVATGLAGVALAAGGWRSLWAAGILLTLAMAGWTITLHRNGRLAPLAREAGHHPAIAHSPSERLW